MLNVNLQIKADSIIFYGTPAQGGKLFSPMRIL